MPSWDALVLHCKRTNYIINAIVSAKTTKCSILNKHAEYGWSQIGDKIVVNWGKADIIIADMGDCGCHGGCDTNRCSCYSASRQCTHTCRCTNCSNIGSIGKNSSSKQNTTTVVATTGEDKSEESDNTDNDITDNTEKIEEEIAPLNTNTEIMDWEDYNIMMTCM